MMEYRFIYRLMPKWTKFIYCFDVMMKNKSGSLHLSNGYCLNFETMMIESDTHSVDLVDKIASFFETEEHWIELKFAGRINDRSEALRNLLREALKE